MTLDRQDKLILKLLQVDGRLSNADLAAKIGASKTSCWNRTRVLIEKGYIKEFKAILDPEKIGLSMEVFIGVSLEKSTIQSFTTFEEAVKNTPEIVECRLLSGEFDYLLKLRVKDIQAYTKLQSTVLLALPGLRHLRTFFTIKEVKATYNFHIT